MFKNLHMGIEIAGVRTDVMVKTEDHIRKQLNDVDINTWEDVIAAATSQRLYGNTKLTDLPILVAIYKFELNLPKASKHLGYAPSIRNNLVGDLVYTTKAIEFRLKRMNVDNMFNVIEPFIEKGIVTRENIRHILEGKRHYKKGERRRRSTTIFRYYARWYVMDALREFINKAEAESSILAYEQLIQLVATHIGVSTAIIWYWIDAEIEDVMVKPSN